MPRNSRSTRTVTTQSVDLAGATRRCRLPPRSVRRDRARRTRARSRLRHPLRQARPHPRRPATAARAASPIYRGSASDKHRNQAAGDREREQRSRPAIAAEPSSAVAERARDRGQGDAREDAQRRRAPSRPRRPGRRHRSGRDRAPASNPTDDRQRHPARRGRRSRAASPAADCSRSCSPASWSAPSATTSTSTIAGSTAANSAVTEPRSEPRYPNTRAHAG